MAESGSLGWIGCGRMGAAMARRLLAGGHAVRVTNRTRAKAEALAGAGAEVVDAPRDLADCDVVFVMVSGNDDLIEVVEGPAGVLSDPDHAPAIVVDCSTVASEVSARVRAACAARGVAFLASPVSGNPKVVAAGQLTLAASGSPEAFAHARPYLELLGRGVTYVGDGEAARLVKICHNVLLGVVTQALSEITVLAEKGGISRHAFLDFMNHSVMGSMFSTYKSPALVHLDFTPTFTTRLLRKDFDLAMAAAHDLGVAMPVAALSSELVASAMGAGLAERDFAALLLEQARRSGLELVAEDVAVDDGLEAS